MSEVLIKNSVHESKNSAIIRLVREANITLLLDAAPFYRQLVIKKERPIKNFDDKLKYVRIEASEEVEIIFDDKSQIATYFEIMVSQPKNLTIKYHGTSQVLIELVGGV